MKKKALLSVIVAAMLLAAGCSKNTESVVSDEQSENDSVSSKTSTDTSTQASTTTNTEIEPVDSNADESEPVSSTSADSEPVESTPVESTPVESTPVESAPVESSNSEISDTSSEALSGASLINPEGCSAEELAEMFDNAINLFQFGKVGECDGLEGVCVYNGSDSFEWLETLFKQYFTDEMFDEFYDEETGNFLSYANVDGVCHKRVLGFGGPQPDVIGYEIVTNDDTEIVLRTRYSDSFTETEYSTISSMVNTENGWRISQIGVYE